MEVAAEHGEGWIQINRLQQGQHALPVEQRPQRDHRQLTLLRRLRPGQLEGLKASSLNLLQQQLFGPGGSGARPSGLLALIETPEAMAAYLLRAQGQVDLKRRARRCIEAAEEARRLAQVRGWLPQA